MTKLSDEIEAELHDANSGVQVGHTASQHAAAMCKMLVRCTRILCMAIAGSREVPREMTVEQLAEWARCHPSLEPSPGEKVLTDEDSDPEPLCKHCGEIEPYHDHGVCPAPGTSFNESLDND